MSEYGRFTEGINSARRALAGAADAARLTVFMNAANDIAGFVAHGLDRTLGADALTNMAYAYGLHDTDTVQSIITQAFEGVEQEMVPDDIAGAYTDYGADIRKSNGHDKGLKLLDAGDDFGFIDPREWLLGTQFCRQYISSIVAAGGTGKSALRLLQFISMASGRELCGQHVFRRARILLISLEDDEREIKRRIVAVLKHYDLPQSMLKGWLIFCTPRLMFKIAETDEKKRIRIQGQLENQIRQTIEFYRDSGMPFDLISLDPFVKMHSLEENDSGDMNYVCDILAKLSIDYSVAIDSPHHVHKGQIEPGNADAGRGSTGIRDAARLVYTLCSMSESEAETFGVLPDQRRFFVRLDPAKVNIAAPPAKATWFKLIGVPIGNSTSDYPSGDTVQVAEPWTPPTPWDVSSEVLNRILDDIAKGMEDGRRYSNAPAATDRQAWNVVQKYCPDKAEGLCRQIISAWLESGLLYPDDYDDPLQRRKRKGLFVNDAKRPS